MTTLAIGVIPHLISAATIASEQIDRAMSEPLSEDRDEVIYLICSHQRVALGKNVDKGGWQNAYPAKGGIGGPFTYDTDSVWARVRFPEGVRASALGWAVLDPLLESVEGLVTDSSFDPATDYDGEDGRHRHELLAWVFARHLEIGEELEVDRGSIEGGVIDFRVEYIGKSGGEALRRAGGAHHKMPLVLGEILVYEPERLVYVMPCDLRALVFEPEPNQGPLPAPQLSKAVEETGVERELLIAAAEEALIAAVGGRRNVRNTGIRQFPTSSAGDRLSAAGVDSVVIALAGLPPRVSLQGTRQTFDCDTPGIEFPLP